MANILYAKGELVAILNDFSHYFLGELKEDLQRDAINARIQWWTNIDHLKVNEKIGQWTRLRRDYIGRIPSNSILSNIPDIVRHTDGTVSIEQKDIDGIDRMLKQSLEAKPINNDNAKKDFNVDADEPSEVSLLNFCEIVFEIFSAEHWYSCNTDGHVSTTREHIWRSARISKTDIHVRVCFI